MLIHLRRLALLTGVGLLVGCAAAVTQTHTSTQPSGGAAKAQTSGAALVLFVTGRPAIQANVDWQTFVEEWQTSMSDAAAEAKMPFVFTKGEESLGSGPATLVRVTVNDFTYMSTAKRYIVGSMAGNAAMDVDAEYFEVPSKKPLGSKKFNASTSFWQGIFSAATPKQVQAVSAQIVKDIATLPSQ